eukprot:TRINITY_DN13628_c0_g1_i1.p1 TRINITY_DN13628_c0_g1~~TRINITY_DN13628_c0_g1_i1.p1  ORF type:complete len:233 (+),score=28.08 TRINITY_DN13628_c0_g1_i1:32-700(+)
MLAVVLFWFVAACWGQCTSHGSCDSCLNDFDCGWCQFLPSGGRCVSGDANGPYTAQCNQWNRTWYYTSCNPIPAPAPQPSSGPVTLPLTLTFLYPSILDKCGTKVENPYGSYAGLAIGNPFDPQTPTNSWTFEFEIWPISYSNCTSCLGNAFFVKFNDVNVGPIGWQMDGPCAQGACPSWRGRISFVDQMPKAQGNTIELLASALPHCDFGLSAASGWYTTP